MNADELRRIAESARTQSAKQKAEDDVRAKHEAVARHREFMWTMAKHGVEYQLDDSRLEEAAKRGDTTAIVFTDDACNNPATAGLGTEARLDALYAYTWVHGHFFGRSDPYKLSGRSNPYTKNCNDKCHFEVTRMPDYMRHAYDAIVSKGFRVRWMVRNGSITIIADWK